MELVKIMRELWGRKILAAAVLGVSLLVGLLLAFRPGLPPHSRQYEVSLSSADILVDTRDSQVAAVNGHGPDLPTLAARANLIGNLMTGGPLKDAIAKRAEVPAGALVVVPPANPATPGVPALPVRPPGSRGLSDAESTILSLSTDENLPILHIVAQAPSESSARKLTAATVAELKKYVGTVAASQDIPAVHQLVVREFGAPVAESATRGLPRSYALGAALALALLGCGAIIGGSWFVRSWKQIDEAEGRGRPGGASSNGASSHSNGSFDSDRGKSGEPESTGSRRLSGSFAAFRLPL